ncbi:MAG: NAD-dependent epimerase/dehydratase family protein [Opitutaceae bacterium]
MSITEKLPESLMIFGCGYVGKALAQYCLQNGVRVGALTRNEEKAAELQRIGVSDVIVADLDSDSWHDQLSEPFEAVVNCVSSAGGGIAGYRKSYLDGQASILRWAKTQRIKRYVYTSSTSVYPQDGGVEVDELADTTEAPPTGSVILESEALIAAAEADLERWYVLRLAGIYGPGRHYLLNQLLANEETIPGAGDYTLNVIHLDDSVSAICAALTSEEAPSGIYNIADDAPTTKEAMVHWLASDLSLKAPTFDPSNVSPRLARRGGRMPDRRILNSKARQQLGWQPKYPSFREGYRALLDAQKSRNP